jgi:hypothetical protein
VAAEPWQRVGRHRVGKLILWDVGHSVTEVVAAEPEGDAFNEGGSATAARPVQRFVEGGFHGQRVVAVNANTGHSVPGGAVGDLLDLHRVRRRSHLGVQVVLAHEN